MRLIIEKGNDGSMYIYRESEKHYRRVERQRANLKRVGKDVIDQECNMTNFPYNSYMVFHLKKKKNRTCHTSS